MVLQTIILSKQQVMKLPMHYWRLIKKRLLKIKQLAKKMKDS